MVVIVYPILSGLQLLLIPILLLTSSTLSSKASLFKVYNL